MTSVTGGCERSRVQGFFPVGATHFISPRFIVRGHVDYVDMWAVFLGGRRSSVVFSGWSKRMTEVAVAGL